MAVVSHCENNGGKENNPSSSSVKPAVAHSKKRKLRMPLEDITNLVYPGCVPSLQGRPFVLDNTSVYVFLLACYLGYQVKNHFKRGNSFRFRNSSAAAAVTLRKHFR